MAQAQTREQQVKEILKCGNDVSYFIKTYVKIQHPMKGLIQFRTFPYQDECLTAFEEHRFNIVLKSRQLGLSTVSAAYALWLAIFQREKNILCIATKLPTAINFIKKVKVAWESLPQWLKLPKEHTVSKSEITFDNGSQIKAIPTSEDAGRSEALSLLIVDETAWVRDFSTIWTGLYPTLSAGGAAILISTPNGTAGVGAPYYHIWTEAESGQNDFHPIRLPWQVHPEHDQKWFDKEVRQLGGATSKKTKQELLCDFGASGDTYLQPDDLDWLSSKILEPISKEGYNKNVWVWKRPEVGKRYVAGADVARGDGADYSTFHILEFETNDLVVEFMGKLPPDRFAELLSDWGKKYNNALLAPELNTYGYMTCVKLRDDGYQPLYYKKNRGDPYTYVNRQMDELPGFTNEQKSRIQILSKLEEAIRNKKITIYSRRLYEQLNTFVWNNGKAQASAESHDDLVISIAIACWLAIGDTKLNENEQSMMYAILNSTQKAKADDSAVMQRINNVKSLTSPSMSTYNQYSVYRPKEQGDVTRTRPGLAGMFDRFNKDLLR